MATFEEEFQRFRPVIRRLTFLALLGKKFEVRRPENFVQDGPNIIVGNHSGSFKDVATILKIVSRPVFFTANRMIFTREEFDFLICKHLRRHLKDFGLVVNSALKPLKYLFVRYVSANIAKVGTIPVDLHSTKREAFQSCLQYLKKDRAIIALQGRGRVHSHAPHPYVSPFRRGASILAYLLYKEDGIAVPVTPLAMFGTHIAFLVPGKIRVNVGEPMHVTSYLGGGFEETVERFRDALETRVK
ncbi:MAG: 1-acyl-sn-glycerol-3-phosphate acyltransferase, partial [Candidatus Aminicenantes bacterium]|nr:1-acyl-sn-glycerol-3-phosphate acyltransferase [Candidatus Aminicenantes bacterium]